MAFLYLVGTLGLVLLVLDRLVDLTWWQQLAVLAAVAGGWAAVFGLTFWAVAPSIYFAVLASSAQAGVVEYLRAARTQILRSKSPRGRIP